MQFSYDSDPKQAADTRVKLLDMIAANKTPVMSYHFAWPGFGNIAKTSEGFHYYPSAMVMNPPTGRFSAEASAPTSISVQTMNGTSGGEGLLAEKRFEICFEKRIKFGVFGALS